MAFDYRKHLQELGVPPEHIEAIISAHDGPINAYMLADVAKSIASQVNIPGWTPTPGWGHGACRTIVKIGGYEIGSFEDKKVPSDADLSDLRYYGFYRQEVKNKHTGEIGHFAAVVPLEGDGFRCDVKREEIEAAARESFLKLQELVEEFHNRKAA